LYYYSYFISITQPVYFIHNPLTTLPAPCQLTVNTLGSSLSLYLRVVPEAFCQQFLCTIWS